MCVDIDHELVSGEQDCDFGMKYQSVVAEGTLEIVTDPAARAHGLDAIMHHYTGRTEFTYDPRVFEVTRILKMTVQSISGKKKGS